MPPHGAADPPLRPAASALGSSRGRSRTAGPGEDGIVKLANFGRQRPKSLWLCQTKALRNGLGFRAQARNLTIPVEVAKRAGILARVLKPVEGAVQRRGMSVLGVQPFTLAGATVFVLPNPSGRNANYSYAEMLTAFRALKSLVDAA